MIEEIENLEKLEFGKQVVFAYLTCERLYPNYVYFSNNFNFGDSDILREAIDFVYANLFKVSPNKNDVNSLIERVEKLLPDTGEFDTIFVSSALDACSCVLHTLSFMIDKQPSELKHILTCATDTVDMYVREIEDISASDKDFMRKVYEHPLMRREISIQQGIIVFLSSSRSLDYNDIQTLLNLQDNNGKRNLDL